VLDYYQQHRSAPNPQAITTALGIIEARAQFDGPLHPVFLRVAPDGEGGLVIDLGDPDWTTVHVTHRGWSLTRRTGVRFRRSPGMLALPTPIGGGSLDEMRSLLHVVDEEWAKLKAWLRQAARDRGPFPVLGLYGEQGSGKTTVARMLRQLIDPSTPELRSDPRETRDLAIAAQANWVLAFDNISSIRPWLSDVYCRLSTGGGWVTRALYTDSDEVLFETQRPILLNGITEFIVRGDLLDRSLQITLPSISEGLRREESDVWAEFERLHPRLLGGLLDDLVAGLHELPNVHLDAHPRMADFARFAVAAERGRAETPIFLDSYMEGREAVWEQAIEGSVIGDAFLKFVDGNSSWDGTAGELLQELRASAYGASMNTRYWPGTPRALSGELRRLLPALRGLGIQVHFGKRVGHSGRRVIRIQCASPDEPSAPSAPSAPSGHRSADRSEFEGSTLSDHTTSLTDEVDRIDGADGADGWPSAPPTTVVVTKTSDL
jgi:hypothetical protein